ncbi:MAG: cob(I)yrinic acid a,c-diamide adenosyltransferase [Phycisphaerae bacterium]|nr:cob(I)yrinic acid a,c-diamide adenosyltransferase [Phycisphaerae bacterium]
MSIYTKTGDDGLTRRMDGKRVRKSDPFLEMEGALDELNSHLGLCVAEARRLSEEKANAKSGFDDLIESLQVIQRQLFGLGAILGGLGAATGKTAITPQTIEQMEYWIDSTEANLPKLRHFILPDGGELSTRLHVARTVARRAERDIVRFADTGGDVPPIALAYINRLGDLLFVTARLAGTKLGLKDQEL